MRGLRRTIRARGLREKTEKAPAEKIPRLALKCQYGGGAFQVSIGFGGNLILRKRS